MDAPQNITQLQLFLGTVTFYWNMWLRRPHLLALLTELTRKSKFKWTTECDNAFKTMKHIMASEVLMVYLDINLLFHIYTDASNYQMGVVILQHSKLVAY